FCRYFPGDIGVGLSRYAGPLDQGPVPKCIGISTEIIPCKILKCRSSQHARFAPGCPQFEIIQVVEMTQKFFFRKSPGGRKSRKISPSFARGKIIMPVVSTGGFQYEPIFEIISQPVYKPQFASGF